MPVVSWLGSNSSWMVSGSNSSWMVSGSFIRFQVVPCFSKYLDVLTKKVGRGQNWDNIATTAILKAWTRKKQLLQNIY